MIDSVYVSTTYVTQLNAGHWYHSLEYTKQFVLVVHEVGFGLLLLSCIEQLDQFLGLILGQPTTVHEVIDG